jgi:hypothetical protein
MKRLTLIILLVAVAGLLGLFGCKERFVPFVNDANEIQRYLDSTRIAQDLFRWDSLILPTPYTLPFSSALWHDTILRHERKTIVKIDDSLTDFGNPIGKHLAGYVRVEDIFTVRTWRTYLADTNYIDNDRHLVRRGWFIKLGSDLEPYVGWVLWTYSGGDGTSTLRVHTTMKQPGEVEHSVDQFDSIRVHYMDSCADGATWILNTSSNVASSQPQPAVVLTAATDAGFIQRSMHQIDRQHYTDTLKTPTNNPRIWNLIFLQTFHDNEFFFTGGFCVPYRVPVL